MEILSFTEPSADSTRIIRCSDETLRDSGMAELAGFAAIGRVDSEMGGVRERVWGAGRELMFVRAVRCVFEPGTIVLDWDGDVEKDGTVSKG